MSELGPETVQAHGSLPFLRFVLLVFGSLGLAGVGRGFLLIEAYGKAALPLKIEVPGKIRWLLALLRSELDQNVLYCVFKEALVAAKSIGFLDFVKVMSVQT